MKPNSENSKIPIRNQKSQMNLQRGRVKKKKKDKKYRYKESKGAKERKKIVNPSQFNIYRDWKSSRKLPVYSRPLLKKIPRSNGHVRWWVVAWNFEF